MKLKKFFTLLIIFFFSVATYAQDQDQSKKIAQFIQSNVKYTTCRSLIEGYVKCKIELPMGISIRVASATVEHVANTVAQVGRIAATIYYTGYVGNQKVCEYKYDMWSRTVTKEF